jgi:hypothetical protein
VNFGASGFFRRQASVWENGCDLCLINWYTAFPLCSGILPWSRSRRFIAARLCCSIRLAIHIEGIDMHTSKSGFSNYTYFKPVIAAPLNHKTVEKYFAYI